MRQRLALVHGHQGPWVSTHGMCKPVLRITGLKEGYVLVHFQNGSAEPFYAEGTHEIQLAADWMRCEYVGSQPASPICVIRGRAA